MAKGIKTGGREQGTPNKLTKELRSILKNILAKEMETIPVNLEKLEQLVMIFHKLLHVSYRSIWRN